MLQTPMRTDDTDAIRRRADAHGGRGPILQIEHLSTHFILDEGVVRAVDDVSLKVCYGETLGVVGESGSGKSVTAQSILQIVGAGAKIVAGRIVYRGLDRDVDLTSLQPKGPELRAIRGGEIAIIFQEPTAAFAPVYTIGRQVVEAIQTHQDLSKRQARERAAELLARVGIPQPRRALDRYPFELSGGMLQRAMIAMALSCEPKILIADEPTTALDVTIQGQILELLGSLQAESGMAIMLISHNMGVIAELADTVAVMYLGRVMEEAPAGELFDHPRHPYTKALLESIPMVEEDPQRRLRSIRGAVPNPFAVPAGCPFHPRCESFVQGACDIGIPPLALAGPEHRAACILVDGADDD